MIQLIRVLMRLGAWPNVCDVWSAQHGVQCWSFLVTKWVMIWNFEYFSTNLTFNRSIFKIVYGFVQHPVLLVFVSLKNYLVAEKPILSQADSSESDSLYTPLSQTLDFFHVLATVVYIGFLKKLMNWIITTVLRGNRNFCRHCQKLFLL